MSIEMNKNRFVFFLFLTLLISSDLTAQRDELEYRDGYYFKNGMLYSGTHVTYFEDGGVQMEMKIRNGLLDGVTKIFYLSGIQKEQRYYHEGEMDSLWINWSELGVKVGEARYKKGTKDGFWYIWDEKGVLRYKMFYREGKKAGIWYIWDEQGKLVSEKNYDI
jgi:antitoxin component YwqK of YwqJK toxin-antitoxin module